MEFVLARIDSSEVFVLPARERTRLHRRSYRAQQKEHAEVCGFLASDESPDLHLVFVPNRSASPGMFEVSREDEERARVEICQMDKVLVGAFHSHPLSPATPSESDIARATPGHLLLIYDVCGRDVKLWLIRRHRTRRVAQEMRLRLL